MKHDTPSATAILIAQSLVFVSRDPRYRSLMPTDMVPLSRAFLRAVLAPWQVGALEFFGGLAPARWLVRLIERFSVPGMIGHYIVRKRRLEDIVAASAQRYCGLGQLVILGAGFDTLGTRMASSRPDLRVYELDHPATSAAKLRAFASKFAALPANLELIPVDLAVSDPLTILRTASEFSFAASTLFIAEGVFMYLELEAVGRTLDILHEFAPGRAGFAFTYMLPSADDGRPAFRGQDRRVDRWLGRQREAFVWGATPDALDAFLAQRGLKPLEHTDGARLRDAYLLNRGQSGIATAVGENIAWIER
jgi:methyltransferase (TIGR00027 family)